MGAGGGEVINIFCIECFSGAILSPSLTPHRLLSYLRPVQIQL